MVGESSGVKQSEVVWATLVPLDTKYSVIELKSNEVVICSEISSSSSDKHDWCKITRNPDFYSATVHGLSSKAILIDGTVVHKEDAVVIINGSEMISGPDIKGYLSYKFDLVPAEDCSSQQLKISLDVDHLKCCICLNVWHDVVTAAPCLHNFCNGCFSEWLRRSQEKHTSVLCPQCRAVVHFVGRNHFLHTISVDILNADASLKRCDKEYALLDSYASIRSHLVITSGKKKSRKRVHSPLAEENHDIEVACPQCVSEVGGFHCNRNTIHLQCQACGGMMPSRTNISVPQHCLGCDRAFCGAYWHAERITQVNTHPVCSHETLKPISERTISMIPLSTHESNRHEQDITGGCIRKMGMALQDVISDWIVKLNNREIDRTRLQLNNAETITSATHVCNECYDKLASFLLYWVRICMPKHLLSPEADKRVNCWYGYACRTQHHNEDHARKRNHVCRPTRGPNM